jgi:RNA polymerase sigma factor (sigma-70 family)
MSQNEDFAGLVARARQGDREAMAHLLAECEPEIRRVARSRLGPALRARIGSQDLVQSVQRTLIRCLRQNKFTFTGPKDLAALAVDMLKKRVAREAARHQREKEILQLRANLLARADPERAAELAREVMHLLETVKGVDQQILILHLQGYTTAEMAGKLNLKPDSLRVRRGRLFRKLRAASLYIDQPIANSEV